jgi:hypothetical protein
LKAKFVVLVLGMVLVSLPAQAEMFKAKRVQALDGNVKCLWARDRLVTVISGPCEKYTPPQQVRVGETFQANGKIKTIKLILAHRTEKDIPSLGLKAGDWTCTAGESSSDLPALSGKQEHTGTWLYIAKCRPVE